MENNSMSSRATAKDFFLHLGAMIGLYASAIAFVNLLFSVINKAYPQVMQYYYYYSTPNISFPVATLIIVFPLFLLLSYFLEREYSKDPSKKETWVRRWSAYITLFVSGLILVGDLVTVLYKFLDGQELTTAFILKALVVLGVTALVFGYYLQHIREQIPSWRKKFWAVFTAVIVLVSIILGFSVIGSPRSQRFMRIDSQKVSDLQNIQWQIVSIWQRKGALPATLAEANDPISSYMMPNDPDTGAPYEYNKTGEMSFELCANFHRESVQNTDVRGGVAMPSIAVDSYYGKNENWDHTAGRVCFARTIDPQLYPVYPSNPVNYQGKGMME